jgi:prevent-host-death family protein
MTAYTWGMVKTYSVADARTHLPDILDDVEAGQEIQLTRRGRTVAILLSPEKYEALRRERCNFGDAYQTFRDRYALGGRPRTRLLRLDSRSETGRRVKL